MHYSGSVSKGRIFIDNWIEKRVDESMNIELQQKLIELAEEIIENKIESRSKGLPPWKKGVGILPGDAPCLFSEIL